MVAEYNDRKRPSVMLGVFLFVIVSDACCARYIIGRIWNGRIL